MCSSFIRKRKTIIILLSLTAGGDGGRFDLGKILFWERSFVLAVRLYEFEGGSGGERGLRLTSGERYMNANGLQNDKK